MAAKLSSGGGGRYSEDQNAEINVTPFVDVMLVLLIIFMVAAPLASVTVKVVLPPAVAKPGVNPPKPVYISIQPGGNIFIQDFRTDLADLGDDLRKSLGELLGALEDGKQKDHDEAYDHPQGEVLIDLIHATLIITDACPPRRGGRVVQRVVT